IEFGIPLVSDGNGGPCTSQRLSPSLLNGIGLSAAGLTDTTPIWDDDNLPTNEQLEDKQRIPLVRPPVSPIAGAAAAAGHKHGHRHAAPTIQEFARRYLAHLADRSRTRGIHEEGLRDHILPQFGRFRLDEIAHSDIAGWLRSISGQDG